LLKKFSIPLVDGPYQHDHDEDESIRTIYECNECGHLSGDLYDTSRFSDYYASLADDYYSSHDYDQSRYKQILGTLPNQSVMRVLDIGCGTGTFLAMLPPGTERFGIEPSRAAANRARAEGVETIQYDDLLKPELRNTFDLVTAIDVVEHTANLLELRRYFSAALRPGGTLIILTGDAKSESARFLGRYWSYLNYAEHITIFCPRSMRTWLKADFSVTQLTKTDHHPLHLREGLSLIRIWLLFPVKWLCRKLLPMRLDMYTALWLPGDHMLVRAIRKPS
jgi:SAM-dependent methyltransferase